MFEEIMRREIIGILNRVAEGEGLNADYLVNQYFPTDLLPFTELKPTAPARKAKVVTRPASTGDGASSSKCTATTAKGKPCSMRPLEGKCVCHVHDKPKKEKAPAKPAATASAATSAIKKKKTTTKKKKETPMHTHELDETIHEDCELCSTHGTPLENDVDDEDFETVTSPPRTLRERLTKIAMYENEEEEEDDD